MPSDLPQEALLGIAFAAAAALAAGLLVARRLMRNRRRGGWRQQILQMRQALEQLDGASQRIAAQTQQRLAQLESLIAQADRKIAQLRNLSGDGGSEGKYVPQPSGSAQLRTEIMRMESLGMDATQIAQKLGIDAGEVELILRLWPKSARGQ